MQRDEIKKLRHRRISNQLEAARLQKWSTEDLVGQSVKLIWTNKWIPLVDDHQSVAGSNYLAASVAWWSQVFHFFSCLDRLRCSMQGWFCATTPSPSPLFHRIRCPALFWVETAWDCKLTFIATANQLNPKKYDCLNLKNVHRFLLFSSQPSKCPSFSHCSPLSLCPGNQDL